MAVEYLHFNLRGWGGAEPTGTRFFEVIGLDPGAGFVAHPSVSHYEAARVVLFELTARECRQDTELYEEFATRLEAGLKCAAEWLGSLAPSAFEEWRNSGMKADLFIGGWMNSDQFDLTLPPELLLACGRLGLPIGICTND